MTDKKSRLILKDPIYKNIVILDSDKKYIDHPYFQRLRNIKQLSFVDYVFPSANHTRFSHSIGAYRLMRKALRNSLIKTDAKTKRLLRLAALLHDIGHGPFSHLWEKVFPHFNHEQATREILTQMGLSEVADVIEKKHELSALISSTIDVDKLDYMARDSYFAGVSYGFSEVEYILENISIKQGKLFIKPKAISSVEDLITQRINLFKTVYFHKFAIGYDFLFIKIFTRVQELLNSGKEVFVNKDIQSFIDKTNTTQNLLGLNDSVILYHIQEWSHHEDKILREFSSMFLQRKKFNVINLAHKKLNISEIKKKTLKKYDKNYYFSYVKIPLNILQTPIFVDFGDKQEAKELSEISELIKFYTKQHWQVEYLIFPRDISF